MEKMIDMAAFCKGDQKEFRNVMDKYYMPLLFYAESFHKHSGAAPEIVNESFIKLFNKHKDFDSEPAVKSFLYTVVKNLSLNNLLSEKARKNREIKYHSSLPEKEEPSLLLDSIRTEVWAKIVKGIEDLPDGCKAIFKLHLYENMSNVEIAQLLNITISTVRNQISNARKRLMHMFLNNTPF